MKTKFALMVVLLALVLVFGCGKKDQPQAADQSHDQTAGVMDSAVKAVKDSFSMEVNLEKTVADLKAEAAEMDVESLKKTAAKYKDAIAEKETELKSLMDKLSAIPLTEKMGKEAQSLTAEVKTVTDGLGALRERFEVYIDALAEKGAVLK